MAGEVARETFFPGARLCRGDQPQPLRNEWRVRRINPARRSEVLRLVEDDTAALRGRMQPEFNAKAQSDFFLLRNQETRNHRKDFMVSGLRYGIVLGRAFAPWRLRSEERRVGKECRSRSAPDHLKKKYRKWEVRRAAAKGLYARGCTRRTRRMR